MAGYLRFEFYKQKKNKYYYLFFIIILASNITKAIPLINTDINWASFPLLAVPETVLLLVLFTIFLATDLVASEYEKGILKLPIMVNGERKKLIKAKMLSLIIWIILLVIFDIGSSYIVGKLLLKQGTTLVLDGQNVLAKGVQIQGIEAIFTVVISELSIIIPLISFGILMVFISSLVRKSSLVMGIGFLYYIISIISPDKTRYIFLIKYIYKLPSFMIIGSGSLEPAIYILISLIIAIVLVIVNIFCFWMMEILK